MDNFFAVVLGAALIVLGVEIYFDPIFYSSQYSTVIDFTGFNIPVGFSSIVIGVISIWSVLRKKRRFKR